MPTKILFQTWKDVDIRNPLELIGYCKESPLEVLQEVFQTHLIHQYKELYRPVDWDFPNNCSGLELVEAETPTLNPITKTVKDLDLSRGRAKLDSPRTEQTYLHALKKAIELDLINIDYKTLVKTNYLDIRDQERNKYLEIYVSQLLEVAQVTLGIKEPNVEDLKRILNGE